MKYKHILFIIMVIVMISSYFIVNFSVSPTGLTLGLFILSGVSHVFVGIEVYKFFKENWDTEIKL